MAVQGVSESVSDYITSPSPEREPSRHLVDPPQEYLTNTPRSPNPYRKDPGFSAEPVDQLDSNSKIWCHTAGRVSCLVRSPIYAAGCIFQIPKMALKLTFSAIEFMASFFPVTIYNIYACCTGKQTAEYFKGRVAESWSFKGLARDGIATLNLAQRTANSIWLTIVAPPSQYRSFTKAVQVATEVAKGKYHQLLKKKQDEKLEYHPTKISDVWEAFVIPNYFHQISSCCRNSNLEGAELNG